MTKDVRVAATGPVHAPAERAADSVSGVRPASFTVAATGDFLLHDVLIRQGAQDASGSRTHDFLPMLKALKPVISKADLAICHIETPIAAEGSAYTGYPVFNSPPQIVDAVERLGYDTCSTASNHTLDKGAAGVRRTLAALDEAGIEHAGSARSAAEARRTTMLDVKGVRVAQLSYTYGTNGVAEPAGKEWLVNDGLDADVILADARRAKEAGADVVILSAHWGVEYQHEPSAQQRRLAERLLASPDVDLIIGDHAHVVQPFERFGDKWVLYGLGNQVANPTANAEATHEGMVGQFTFRYDEEARAWRASPAFIPTLVVPGPPIRLVNLAAALKGSDALSADLEGESASAAMRARYAEAATRTARVARSLGADVPVGK
ncbi:CapA family protein [Bailinhaonella thermotolerans]|uniref:CapA family protein n=1 Tax=Bailinhaonella thermotolerans TaxID=1070861 RepID=UPI00192A389C|nr:CapA family protein [Bailinhaonella thermotolerans]